MRHGFDLGRKQRHLSHDGTPGTIPPRRLRWVGVSAAICLLTSCLAVVLTAQTGEGPALLAAFKAWQKTSNPAREWSEALEHYERTLVRDGLSQERAARAIRLITAYDEAELYDSVYEKAPVFSTAPNQFLVEVLRGVTPGRALDVGMGQGRNTLHLARRGWDVTGFDVSRVGVRSAEAQARSETLRVRALVAADEEFDFGVAQWDLIAVIYAIEKRSILRVRDALKPGGLVVVEAGINPDPAASFGYAPGALPKLFDGFTVLRHDETEGPYDWGPERIRLVRFAARKPLAR